MAIPRASVNSKKVNGTSMCLMTFREGPAGVKVLLFTGVSGKCLMVLQRESRVELKGSLRGPKASFLRDFRALH